MVNTKLQSLICLAFLAVSASASHLDLDAIFDAVDELSHETKDFLDRLERAQSKNPNQMDMGCVTRHCSLKLPAAMIDPNFYKESNCALTYESEAMDDLMACAMNHNCITFAPIDVT